MSLSKRQDIDSNDLMIPRKNIPAFAGKDQKKGAQSDEGEDSEEQNASSKMSKNKKEVKFSD